MYMHNDILIVGDSFCRDRTTYDHWPKLLYSELTNNDIDIPRGEGYSGCAWWSVRKHLLNELKIHIPKILIICHTDKNRIPNDNDVPLNSKSCIVNFERSKKIYSSYSKDRELYKAGILYYEYLISKNFNLWCEQQWFYELDYILEQYNIEKIIHLHCFEATQKKYHIFKNGVTITFPLMRYTNKIDITGFANHFTPEVNQKFAACLIDILNNKYINGLEYSENLIG